MNVYICSAARTAIGTYGGMPKCLQAVGFIPFDTTKI